MLHHESISHGVYHVDGGWGGVGCGGVGDGVGVGVGLRHSCSLKPATVTTLTQESGKEFQSGVVCGHKEFLNC